MNEANATTRHILVVDDEPTLLDLIREFLEDEGYRVTVACVAPPTADVARLQPNLLLLDLHLGAAEDGWQAIKRLARDPATASLAVVVCSAAIAEVGARRDDLAARGIGVVLKPFDLDDLLSAVRHGLRPACHRPRWDE